MHRGGKPVRDGYIAQNRISQSQTHSDLLKSEKTMNQTPTIGQFIDDEEKALIEAIERDDYSPGKNHLTKERSEKLQAAARATINEERIRISLRVPKSDLSRLKTRALQEGIPYQTLINSILHKAVVR